MFLATSYTTDGNFVQTYSVPLYIGYNDEYVLQTIVTDPLIPLILIPRLQWFAKHPCPTKKIIARHAEIGLQSGDILKIAYPFRPNTPEWFTFWEQLQSPKIVSIKKNGETTTDTLLRNFLNL